MTAAAATSINSTENQLRGCQPQRSCRNPAMKLDVAVVLKTSRSLNAWVLPRSLGAIARRNQRGCADEQEIPADTVDRKRQAEIPFRHACQRRNDTDQHEHDAP